MGWVSPTGHNDPDSAWIDEAEAYDEDTSSGNGAWSWETNKWLELTLGSSINSDKVRIYPRAILEADMKVDVHYSGAWHNIHDGVLTKDQWNEISIGSTQSVSKARVCNNAGTTKYIVEFDFNEVSGGQTHYGAATLAGAGALAILAKLTLAAKATTSGVGALSAVARFILPGSATMAGSGSLIALGRVILAASATLSGSGALAAAGTIGGAIKYGAVILSGVGALAVAAVNTLSGAATLSGSGSLSAIGNLLGDVFGAATLAGLGSLVVIAESWHILTSQEYQDLLEGQIEFQEI